MYKFLILFLFFFSTFLESQKKEEFLKPKAGVALPYVFKGSQVEKAGLQKGDMILFYANCPTKRDLILNGVDQFLIFLEKEWEKEGKKADYWKKNENRIKHQTRGIAVAPAHFSENGKPLYELVFKREEPATKKWHQITVYIRAGIFVALVKEMQQKEILASQLSFKGLQLEQAKKENEALLYFQKALNIYREINYTKAILNVSSKIGNLYTRSEDFDLALDVYFDVLPLTKQLKEPENTIRILNSIGYIYQNIAEFQKALDFFLAALELSKKQKNSKQSHLLNNISVIYQTLGDMQKALEYGKYAYNTSLKENNFSGQIAILNNLSMIYQKQGNLKNALASLEKTFELAKQSKNSFTLAKTLFNIGFLYQEQKQFDKAMEYYTQALERNEEIGNLGLKASILNSLGKISNPKGKSSEALNLYRQAYEIYVKQGHRSGIALCLNNMATIYQERKEFSKALAMLLKSYELVLQTGELVAQARFALNIAEVYISQENGAKAAHYYDKATESFAAIKAGAERQTFFKINLWRYHKAIKNLIESGFPHEAFKILQYFKAFGFTSQLTEFSIDLEKYISPELRKQKKYLVAKISLAYKKMEVLLKQEQPLAKEIQQYQKKIKRLEKELEETNLQIRLGNPAFSNINYPNPISVQGIQDVLKADQLFLEYFCSIEKPEQEEQGKTYCFVIGKNRALQVFSLGETNSINKNIQKVALSLWDTQEEEQETEDFYNISSKLYQEVLHPLLPKKRADENECSHLIIAPSQMLNLLAFEALALPQEENKVPASFQDLKYVLDRYEISYTMSATVYQFISQQYQQKKSPSKSFFGIGDPLFEESNKTIYRTRSGLNPLPGTRIELEFIEQLLSSNEKKILLGQAAVEPELYLLDLLPYSILHFATHGLIDTEKPLYSSLALTQITPNQQKSFERALEKKGFEPISCSDGFLKVQDIFKLYKKINAELVVLSACETATGKIINGDGIVGLTRAFQFAGSPSIIVSLWAVADDSTAQFMKTFYQELLQNDFSNLAGKKSKALHIAKRKLRHSKKYAAPYYWAPFILRGLP